MKLKAQGKIVGDPTNGVFSKKVKKNHLMKMFGGSYGIDYQVFNQLLPTTKIVITDENGKEFRTTHEEYQTHGIIKNFGHGEQIFLPVKYFNQPTKELKLNQTELI